MEIRDLAEWVRTLDEPSVAPLLTALRDTLDSFVEIGLGYLSLDRPAGTLSGGEAQRVKMIRHLGSSLTDTTYVFDEPTIGLHPHDIQRMNDLLLRLRDKGNTVLVVEHKPEAIAIADHVVDLGPGAGTAGGTVCFEGTVEDLRSAGTVTGRHLDDRAALKETVREPTGVLEIRGANTHNLQDVDVDIPLGVLCVVTGVAGSGKSSLIHGSVPAGADVIAVDQSPIKGSRRSNPATYTGLLDPIRKAFAKANGVKPALFSANSEGACPTCNGAGVIYTDLAMMAGVASPCEDCEGKRFQPSVLEYRFGGRDISEVLAMSVAQAEEFFGTGEARTPAAHKILQRLADVGLGYLTLGQPLTTLSGGERQRLKLATHMGEKGGVYVLDEPTTGLHLADVEQLLACSTAWSTPASRSSSSSTTRRSWPTPTGSSTSVPAPATTAAGSSSRAPPPTSSPTAPPSPASTSRPTSAPDPAHPRSAVPERCGAVGSWWRDDVGGPGAPAPRPRPDGPRVRQAARRPGAGAGRPHVGGPLLRSFRAAYGETPYSYLMTRRIERAKALLRRGDMSVTEVCFAVGCTSLGSFSSRFTELVGESPSAYRARDHADGAAVPACVAKIYTRPVRNGEAGRASGPLA